jgi:hypothetical protein
VSKPELDWAALIGREKRLIQGIPERLEATLLNRGVELVREKVASSPQMPYASGTASWKPSTS